MDIVNRQQFMSQASLGKIYGFNHAVLFPAILDAADGLLSSGVDEETAMSVFSLPTHFSNKGIPLNRYANRLRTSKAQDRYRYKYTPGSYIPSDGTASFGYTLPGTRDAKQYHPKGEEPPVL